MTYRQAGKKIYYMYKDSTMARQHPKKRRGIESTEGWELPWKTRRQCRRPVLNLSLSKALHRHTSPPNTIGSHRTKYGCCNTTVTTKRWRLVIVTSKKLFLLSFSLVFFSSYKRRRDFCCLECVCFAVDWAAPSPGHSGSTLAITKGPWAGAGCDYRCNNPRLA
jgi:hypothetical protein